MFSWWIGAPERVADRCKFIQLNGKVVPFTDDLRREYELGYEDLGAGGFRVLGFAYEMLDPAEYPKGFKFQQEEPFNGIKERTSMVFAGLMALIDPPRAMVPGAIRDCQTGGIQVIMVTGDHPITAKV